MDSSAQKKNLLSDKKPAPPKSPPKTHPNMPGHRKAFTGKGILKKRELAPEIEKADSVDILKSEKNGEEDEKAIVINSTSKKAKTIQPPEAKEPVPKKNQTKDTDRNSSPYKNKEVKKAEKVDVLRDMSSTSSMDNREAPQNEKVSSGQASLGEDKEARSNAYPNNNNYPRKLSKHKEKKNSTATKSIEDQKLVIRKDFIENRQAQLHNQLVNKSEQQSLKKEASRASDDKVEANDEVNAEQQPLVPKSRTE